MIDEANDLIASGEDISPDDLADWYALRDDLQIQIDDAFAQEQLTILEATLDFASEVVGGRWSKVTRRAVEGALTGIRKNAVTGARRQAEVVAELKEKYPNASVQTEQYLRGPDGKILKSSTGSGRRLDVVVVENGKVVGHPIEVTSMDAAKGPQLRKEANIHANNAASGVFIRDRTTGDLLEVTGLISRLERRP